MANSLYQSLVGAQKNPLLNNPQLQQIKNMANMLRGNTNPAQMLQNLAQSNPQLSNILQMTNGNSPKQVFMQMAKQKGINPEDIINALKS